MGELNMTQPELLSPQIESEAAGWRSAPARLAFALAASRRSRLGLTLWGLALLLFVANLAVLPNPLTAAGWLLFGLLAAGGGLLLAEVFHPERLAAQQFLRTSGQLIHATADPWLLLVRATRTLHTTLNCDNLSLWRYHAAESVMLLLRAEGQPPADELAELPVDLAAGQLQGIWPVGQLPESALRLGLQAAGVRTVVWLRPGGELVGGVGLGRVRLKFPTELLQQVTAQFTLLFKNTLLAIDLADARHKLQLAYRRTIDAQDDERRNLAAELHDDILGRLTTMALSLRRSQNNLAGNVAEVGQWLAGLETETQNLNRRLREITQGLHPSVLTDLGLISALRAYMDSLATAPASDTAAKTITLTAQGFDSGRIPAPKLERDLYYIVRQALDNAIKHAQAGQIFVHLRWDTAAVSVTVRDTGRGMAAAPEQLMGHNGHLGLLSMQERALAWQGRLSFHTGAEQGTTVRARLPIGQPSAAPSHLQAYTQYLS